MISHRLTHTLTLLTQHKTHFECGAPLYFAGAFFPLAACGIFFFPVALKMRLLMRPFLSITLLYGNFLFTTPVILLVLAWRRALDLVHDGINRSFFCLHILRR